jgi:hypothetical protein
MMNTTKMQKMTPIQQKGKVECIHGGNEAHEDPLLSSIPASTPQRPDVRKQEQQKKKQMQHSQRRANKADDVPSQAKRSSKDKTRNKFGSVPTCTKLWRPHKLIHHPCRGIPKRDYPILSQIKTTPN